MKNTKQKLLIEQTDKKLEAFKPLEAFTVPENGWIHMLRTSLNMSFRQLAQRLKISTQAAYSLEKREPEGGISIGLLKQAGNALGMKLVYGFIPKDESIEKMIERRAQEIAEEIVSRTSNTMKLEDQENSKLRIKKAIKQKAEELTDEIPRYLWD
ncbi:MAG: Helix-turn-helix domain protein [Bacteroidetes bacterium]|nr:Helix-turn-helix domain protein [Bacteroidota bacterium]